MEFKVLESYGLDLSLIKDYTLDTDSIFIRMLSEPRLNIAQLKATCETKKNVAGSILIPKSISNLKGNNLNKKINIGYYGISFFKDMSSDNSIVDKLRDKFKKSNSFRYYAKIEFRENAGVIDNPQKDGHINLFKSDEFHSNSLNYINQVEINKL